MKELAKKQLCVQMRSGAELWFDEDRIKRIQALLENIEGSKFINLDDQTINTADITGVFNAETMADMRRIKNGEFLCKFGQWHKRGSVCECRPKLKEFIPPKVIVGDLEKIEHIKKDIRRKLKKES